MNTTPLTSKTSAQKQGFTLVELLVVIVIIAALAAMVFPAMRSMRTKAELTKCSAGLRQWAAAIQSYAGDNNQMVRYEQWSKSDIDNTKSFYDSYLGGGIRAWPPSSRKGAKKEGPPVGFFRMCPAQKWNASVEPPEGYIFVNPNELKDGAYARGGVDTDADGTLDSYSFTKVTQPSLLLMMMDASSPINIYQSSEFATYVKPVCIHADPSMIRHGGSVNALFADGHIERLKWDQIDPTLPVNTQKVTTWLNLN